MADVSRVILFDIDGTLIHSARAGVRGMNAAFHSLYGIEGALNNVPLAGRTDRAIVTDGFRAIGREADDDAIRAVRDAYFAHLPVELARPLPDSRVLPGVFELLDALDERDDVSVGLLTGNFEGGASIKLGHFQLWSRFAFGAFGDDHHDRRALVPVALDHVARRGAAVPASRVVIIGDTPLDVDCAQAHGAKCIGVATGPFSSADLSAASADLVVESLEDTSALMRWVNSV